MPLVLISGTPSAPMLENNGCIVYSPLSLSNPAGDKDALPLSDSFVALWILLNTALLSWTFILMSTHRNFELLAETIQSLGKQYLFSVPIPTLKKGCEFRRLNDTDL